VNERLTSAADQFVDGDSQRVGHFIENTIRQLSGDGQVDSRGLVTDVGADLTNDEILHEPGRQTANG